MNLIKYTPQRGTVLDWDLDRMVDNFFDKDFWNFGKNYPTVDVREETDKYVLEADLPGLTEKDIEVKVENELLSISSLKKEEKEEKKDGYLVRERKSTSFARSFVLPKDVNKNAINASFKNGVLTLTLGKSPEAQPKTIDVKSE